jgi:hypothetical protein
MKFILVIITVFAIGSINCRSSDSERDRIVFQNSFDVVRDSLVLMSQVMTGIRNSNSEIDYYVFSLAGDFSMGDQKIGNLANLLNDTLSFLKGMKHSTRENLYSLILFLKTNYISSCSFNRELNLWCFYYRDIPIVNKDDDRFIFFVDKYQKLQYFEKFVVVLDTKDNLVLAKERFD